MDMQDGETATDIPFLPVELLTKIFLGLPVKSLLRFKCVSKSWRDVFNSRKFIKLHLTRSLQANSDSTLIISQSSSLLTLTFNGYSCHTTELYFPQHINLPQPGTLVGSCNGLVCFSFPNDELALYNPATRDYKIIPKITLSTNTRIAPAVGFAYDCIGDDYKVLRFKRGWDNWEAVLYSLSTNAWEIVSNSPWAWNLVKSPCVVVKNSFHWIAHNNELIQCFDFSVRRFYEIPVPEKMSPGYFPKLGDLRGQLCIVTYYLDIWVLKEYDVQESWIRIFHCPSVQWNSLYHALCFWKPELINLACSKDGCKILVAVAHPKYSYYFICCDQESKEAKKIQITDLPKRDLSIKPWVESLVPVSDFVKTTTQSCIMG